MKVVFPYSLKDQEQAARLAAWISDLSPNLQRHSVLIVHDSRCAEEITNSVRDHLTATFGSVETIAIADDAYDSWPHSCNLMFRRAGKHIELGPNPEPWLWLEPDVAPLTPDWLDKIEAEYIAAGKPFMGDRVEVANVPLHMSGVAIYPARLSHHGGLAYLALETAWDVFAAEQIVPQAHFTGLISHSWKHPRFESWDAVEREIFAIKPDCVLFHADKTSSLIDLLRERKNLAASNGTARHSSTGASVSTPGSLPGNPLNDPENPRYGPADETRVVVAPRELQEPGGGAEMVRPLLTCDILIKSHPPDYEWLRYCLRAIDKFAKGFRQVVVIIPRQHAPITGFNPFSLMGDHRYKIIEVEEAGEGYLFQQACKINAHEYTDADYILHIDSDCILTRPITPETFMRNGKPLWLISPYSKIDVPWQAITEKFIGQPLEYEFMRRLPLLVPRSLHIAAARFCEVHHKMRLTDYILSQPHRAFSEFNALGALAYTRARDEFEWLDTHAEEIAA